MLMTDELLPSLHMLQILCAITALVCLMVGICMDSTSIYALYRKITRAHLPACILSYLILVIGILITRYQQGSAALLLIALCVEASVIEVMILHAIRLKRKLLFYDQMIDTAIRIADALFPPGNMEDVQTLQSETKTATPSQKADDGPS